jgi:hypothetical protein
MLPPKLLYERAKPAPNPIGLLGNVGRRHAQKSRAARRLPQGVTLPLLKSAAHPPALNQMN